MYNICGQQEDCDRTEKTAGDLSCVHILIFKVILAMRLKCVMCKYVFFFCVNWKIRWINYAVCINKRV